MRRLGSAVKQSQRPSAALTYSPDPHGEWTRIDYLLLDAFYTLDSEICDICKNPIWLCHSTDNRIDFLVQTRACYAKADIEAFEKTEKGKNLDPGEYPIAVPVGIEGENGEREPLPSRREAYKSMPTN